MPVQPISNFLFALYMCTFEKSNSAWTVPTPAIKLIHPLLHVNWAVKKSKEATIFLLFRVV